MTPTLGQPIGDLALTLTGNRQARLADYHGRHLVLYFYPRDFTTVCTREACGFRDTAHVHPSKFFRRINEQ